MSFFTVSFSRFAPSRILTCLKNVKRIRHLSGESRGDCTPPPPGLLQESLGALRARSVPGVSLGVSLGCLWPRAPECPKSVPRVSRECPRNVRTPFWHSRDTLATLFGHSGARGQRRPQRHSRDTSGPKCPRDSCSRPAGLQRGEIILFRPWS